MVLSFNQFQKLYKINNTRPNKVKFKTLKMKNFQQNKFKEVMKKIAATQTLLKMMKSQVKILECYLTPFKIRNKKFKRKK